MEATKACPLCGEQILAVAIRCKHCQGDLARAQAPAAQAPSASPDLDFEQRFLDFAFTTTRPIHAAAVAYALRIPIAEAAERLEDLAARDVLLREVDERAMVSYQLPGRTTTTVGPTVAPLVPRSLGSGVPGRMLPPADRGTALAALLLNVLVLPGLGSLVGGRPAAGVAQLVLFVVGIPFCLVGVGFFMLLAAWVWALVSGIRLVSEVG
jgi:TM2 domain-containing membrane protein YozV